MHPASPHTDKTFDRHALGVVLAALQREEARIATTRASVGASFQRELANQVLDALGGLLHQQLPPDSLAKELRWIASSVVQRAAEQARTAELGEALDAVDSTPIPATDPLARGSSTHRAADQDAVSRPRLPKMQAAPAWAVTLTSMVLLLPPAIATNGPLLGLLLLLVVGVASFLLAHTIRLVPLPSRRPMAFTVLALLYFVAAMVCCWIQLGPKQPGLLPVLYFVYGVVGYTVVATVIALITSSLSWSRASQERAAVAIAETEHLRFETQRELVAESVLTGSLFDSDIQGDIIATSFQLESGTASPDALDELIDRVELMLRGGPDPSRQFADAIREGLRTTLRAWRQTLEIRVEVDEEALLWLSTHPGSAGIAHHTLTEGLTNIIRYGHSRAATVRFTRRGDAVELAVRNLGRLGPRDPEGLGLRQLEYLASEVELRQDGDEVELLVRVLAEDSPGGLPSVLTD